MASEQATAAAENIASWLRLEAHQFPSDGNVAEWAKIIDAAFAPVVAERDALLDALGKAMRITAMQADIRDADEDDTIEGAERFRVAFNALEDLLKEIGDVYERAKK